MANHDDNEVLIRALRGEPTLQENADEELVKSRLKKIMGRLAGRGEGGNLGCLDGRDGRPPR